MGDDISYESTENNLPMSNVNAIYRPIMSRTNDSGYCVVNNETATSVMNRCGLSAMMSVSINVRRWSK